MMSGMSAFAYTRRNGRDGGTVYAMVSNTIGCKPMGVQLPLPAPSLPRACVTDGVSIGLGRTIEIVTRFSVVSDGMLVPRFTRSPTLEWG